MRIVLTISSMNSGGAERVAATLCNAWVERGDEVILIGMYSGRGECHYRLDPRVRLIWIAEEVGRARGRLTGYAARMRALRRIVTKEGADVLVSFLVNVNVTTLIALRGSGVPVVVSERIDPAIAEGGPVWRLLRRITYPWAAAVTVQTRAAADSLRRIVPGLSRIVVVENPIPVELTLLRRRPATPMSRRRIVGVGRLSEEKQFDHLIEAFAAIARRNPDIDLWIWGEGHLRDKLLAKALAEGLENRVYLPGKTNDPWAEMIRADLMVLTSASEGFPNALLEAMALGVPCVSYDCPSGPREITDGGRLAALVPVGDRRALAVAMSDALDRPDESRAAAERAAEVLLARFALPTVLRRWDKVIEDARQSMQSA
jgi:glycosyltransferase involved in cell wall biosynthesis